MNLWQAMVQKRIAAIGVVIVLVVLLAFCLVFLAVGVVFAVIGGASYNNCQGTVSFCEQMQEQVNTSYQLMAAASVVTFLVFPAMATVVAYLVLELGSGRVGKAKVATNRSDEMQPRTEETDQNDEANVVEMDDCEGRDNATGHLHFHTYKAKKLHREKLKKLTICPGITLYFAFVCFTFTVIAALWMLIIAYNNSSQTRTKLWPFLVTELIMGLACPLVACIGAALLSIVAAYVMEGQVDMRIIIHRMIPSVMLDEEISERSMYWIIAHHFHIKLKKRQGGPAKFMHAIDKNVSTWILAFISGLTVVLAVSSFVNRSFVQTLTVPTAEFLAKSDICLTYSCFTPFTFDHVNVNCSKLNSSVLANINIVHCFKFIPVSSEVIANLSISVGFYLATVHFVQVIFMVATMIHVEKSHRAWSIIFCVVGALIIVVGVVLLCNTFLLYVANIHLDVILAFQIILIGIYLVLIGILLWTGQVYANIEKIAAVRRK